MKKTLFLILSLLFFNCSAFAEMYNFDNIQNYIVGEYRLNETSWSGVSNEVVDSSGNANHGTANGGANTEAGTLTYQNRNGTFDGTDDYVHIVSSATLNPTDRQFSVSCWFKMNAVGTSNASIIYNKENVYEASAGGGYFTYAWSPDWNWRGGTTFSVSVGTWYHAVVTYDGYYQRVYKNGTEVYSAALTGAMVSNSEAFRIGARGGNSTAVGFANADIDEVLIFKKALTPSEVTYLYNSGNGREDLI